MESGRNFIILDAVALRYMNYSLKNAFSGKITHLEIGFGNGQYLIDYALNKKDELFFGIEYAKKYFLKAFHKSQRYGLSNIKLIYGEALSVIYFLFPDDFFDLVHINFPDPWPKKRHNPRRLINDIFVNNLSRILKKEGEIYFASDHEEYFINSVTIFQNNGFKTEYISDLPNKDRIAKTKYEKDFIKSSKKIFYSVLKKS